MAVLQVRQLALTVLIVGAVALAERLRVGVQVVEGVERVGHGIQAQRRQDGDTGQGLQIFVEPGRNVKSGSVNGRFYDGVCLLVISGSNKQELTLIKILNIHLSSSNAL